MMTENEPEGRRGFEGGKEYPMRGGMSASRKFLVPHARSLGHACCKRWGGKRVGGVHGRRSTHAM